ncbi:MarR family winged helix-turn-helix transcriptional regulator [Nakamurella multipartita]|uniref:Transcriptional regulator, MarR family n=1 Tax=Nakamurella multipartita (strain ATCC 700099 / DSM 44233 / CIP 104796 / JCM 9543 / NBRC 105858 / Y-104) TaxID=479431 RepID=C8XAK7_NAKMY|nr:MarR family transcriptional regulator [Nakamurella multipartita]ACV77372.1 transcriptional regulator, MarR family [Nakamurella multipartita DSM 44233]
MADDHADRAALIDRLRVLGERNATETAVFQQAAAAHYGLGVSDMKALGVLVREGRVTAGRLAEELHLTTGAVTGVIDRLTRRGVARRTPDPDDRRKVLVEPDLAALAEGENVYLAIGRAFDELHAGYRQQDLEFLADYLERSIQITHEQTARLVDARPDRRRSGGTSAG